MKIGDLLVQEGLVSAAQLEEALRTQQRYGGRLGTNLVEQGFVNELDLARVLSRQLGIPMVRREELAGVAPEVIALVAPHLARQLSVVPFRYDTTARCTCVAIADPNDLEKEDQLAFALGGRIRLHLCPEIVLGDALERYYGIQRRQRFIKIENGFVPVLSTEAADPEEDITPEDILEGIVRAETTQELLGTTVELLSAYAAQVVFLTVRESELIGWSARGLPAESGSVRGARLPLAPSPVLQQVAGSGRCLLFRPETDEPLREVLGEHLVMDFSESVFLLPLLVGGRLYGVFAFGKPRGRVLQDDPDLLFELTRRLAFRLQAIQLMEHVTAPLATPVSH